MTPIGGAHVHPRSGLTLVETLAAVVLLALIAAACAATFRDLRHDAERRVAVGAALPVGSAEVAAEALLDDPGRCGLASLSELVSERRVLNPDPELRATLESLSSWAPVSRYGRPPLAIHAWRVVSRGSYIDASSGGQSHGAPVLGPTPCWLVIDVGGDIATRCVLLSPEPAP